MPDCFWRVKESHKARNLSETEAGVHTCTVTLEELWFGESHR